MSEQAACSHMRLKCEPFSHGENVWSESWTCETCGWKCNVREADILRTVIAAAQAERYMLQSQFAEANARIEALERALKGSTTP